MSDIVERLRHSITTATNDDLSELRSEKRIRHIARLEAMRDAADEIERLRVHIKELKIEIGELERGGLSWKEATS